MAAAALNLFELAKQNEGRLKQQFDAYRDGLSDERKASIDGLVDEVRAKGRVSTNMRRTGLAAFLSSGKHLNIYEFAAAEAGRTGEAIDASLRRLLGKYYERRMAYDALFVGGKGFRYGALNIGCAGTTRYGDFCLVAKSAYSDSALELAYLKSDSLNDYMSPGPMLNEPALRSDLATESHRQFLAATKEGDRTFAVAREEWPSILCDSSSYIEATFTGQFTPSDLQEVRMSTSDYARVTSLVFEAARDSLSEEEVKVAAGYAEVLDSLRRSSIKLEVLDA
ncbi:MAG TPA: hypothetical protein VNX26_03260 [Candidatus Acidoferrum sp.]|jgi:hypothetical protein|nr:hypothetical protein [Candidatus Acidoferrum sp.]